jgi:hypothetical protein
MRQKTLTDFDNLAQFVSRSYAGLDEDLHTRRISHVRRDVPYRRERVAVALARCTCRPLYCRAILKIRKIRTTCHDRT